MVKKILTRFAVAKKTAGSRDSVYRSPRIYLPTKLTDDSVFPFKEGDLLLVKVEARKLIIQKVRKQLGSEEDTIKGSARRESRARTSP